MGDSVQRAVPIVTASPGPEVIAQALGRAASPGFDRWESQVASAGGCSHPVRLKGSMLAVDRVSGETARMFSTTGEPDGVLLKACGSRRATRCVSCSAVYKDDARHLIRAGLQGGKGMPASTGSHPMVFVTLTAPSFGAVHTTRKAGNGPCRAARSSARCPHGRRLGCWAHHHDDDIIGSPLCSDCYRYEHAVVWNARVGELWRRTGIAIGRALAGHLGIPTRAFPQYYRISFAKVVEYQRRGVVHLHAVIRLDGANGEVPPGVDADMLARAIRAGVIKASCPSPLEGAEPIRWGAQVDIRPIDATKHKAVANYVAKYSTKSADEAGALDRRLTSGDISRLDLSEHLARLVATAWELGGRDELGHLKLGYWAHCLGFRGHWLTKSARYSTTMGALRSARHDFRLSQAHGGDPRDPWGRPVSEGRVVVIGEWSYEGSGYSTTGDAWLAESAAEQTRQARSAAWEQRIQEAA